MGRPAPWYRPDPLPLPLDTPGGVVDAYREEDAPGLHAAIAGDREDLALWLPWAAAAHGDVQASRSWIRELARRQGFAHPEGFHLGLFEAGTRAVLGGVGLVRIQEDRGEVEIGYWLRPASRGRGRCTKAVGRLITSAFRDWGFRRVVIGMAGPNAPSRRVAERLGLRRERTERAARWHHAHGWCDHLGYAVLAEEWDPGRDRGPTPWNEETPVPDDPKAYAAQHPAIAPYVAELLEPEDAVLAEIRARSRAAGLPDIAVGPFDGRHLEVIARAAGARRMVEIGTLGGYSAVCLARALPPGGRLHTFELDPAHAEVAGESLRRAGLADRVTIHVGPALERLCDIEAEAPFDLVFLDADKASYPDYLTWAEHHLRPGGTLLADNVFRKPRGREMADVIHAFNERLARSGLWRATLLPMEDGLAVAVRL